MEIVTIDGKDYDLDALSADIKAQLQMLQATDLEINRLNTSLAIAQTARNAYAMAIHSALPELPHSDSIKFS